MSDDLAILGQDPRLGGGSLAQTRAFVDAAARLGRTATLYHLAYHGLTQRPEESLGIETVAIRPLVHGLDGLNQCVAAHRAAAVASARSLWVVSTVASHGYAAARSERAYACWVGTSLEDEWRGRRTSLPVSRRAALAVSTSTLRRLERRVLRGAAAVYATSPASRTAVAEAAGLPEDGVSILPIPVDTERFTPLPDDEWERRLEQPVVIFVGRASDPRKNIGLLLAAFARLRERVPGARLRLVGEPPSTRLLAGVGDAVEVVGAVHAIEPHLREAALFVLPSRQEGFGIVAAEALAAGVPVVATPSGGPEELLRASGGGRVLSGFEPDELADAMAELLLDVDALRALRAQGRAYVAREHSPERFRSLLGAAMTRLDAHE
ncbi:MAG TPA: glycosyltransferase family 4 protein [Gaiellaceae bacterium]